VSEKRKNVWVISYLSQDYNLIVQKFNHQMKPKSNYWYWGVKECGFMRMVDPTFYTSHMLMEFTFPKKIDHSNKGQLEQVSLTPIFSKP